MNENKEENTTQNQESNPPVETSKPDTVTTPTPDSQNTPEITAGQNDGIIVTPIPGEEGSNPANTELLEENPESGEINETYGTLAVDTDYSVIVTSDLDYLMVQVTLINFALFLLIGIILSKLFFKRM